MSARPRPGARCSRASGPRTRSCSPTTVTATTPGGRRTRRCWTSSSQSTLLPEHRRTAVDPRPSDFDRDWQATLDPLDGQPARPQIDALPLRSTDFATLYAVRITSLGPYRLFGYL